MRNTWVKGPDSKHFLSCLPTLTSPAIVVTIWQIFFRSIQDEPAGWLTILSFDDKHDCLSKLLGLSYLKIYLPLMLQCGLIRETRSNQMKAVNIVPSIKTKNYSWADFISEYKLNIEISFAFLEHRHPYTLTHYAKGVFSGRRPISTKFKVP